jgi:DNA-binding NtrC family response regulator
MSAKALLAVHDPACVKRLSHILSNSGIQTQPCATVSEAVRALSADRSDIVFCQRRLPDGTFQEVLRFADSHGGVPLVVCADFYDKKTYLETMSLGAFDYIAYPFSRRDVEWIVANALRKSLRFERLELHPVERVHPQTVGGPANGTLALWK